MFSSRWARPSAAIYLDSVAGRCGRKESFLMQMATLSLSHSLGGPIGAGQSTQTHSAPVATPSDFPLARAPGKQAARGRFNSVSGRVCEQERERHFAAHDLTPNKTLLPNRPSSPHAVCAEKCSSLLLGEKWKCAICYTR